MKRPTVIALLTLSLLGSLLESKAHAVVFMFIDRDYTIKVAGEPFGVQDYSGYAFGSDFHGTNLLLGPLGKRILPVDSRQALAIGAVSAVALVIAGWLTVSRLTRRERIDAGGPPFN